MIALERLQSELVAAGVPISIVNNGLQVNPDARRQIGELSNLVVRESDGVSVAIDWPDAQTRTTYLATATTVIQAHNGTPRRPRPLYAIYADLSALTNAKKTAIWNDLSSGTPKKYLAGDGPNTAAIGSLDWAVSDSGATGAALTAARLRIAAAYVQDNPTYLVNPSFDNSILIYGDEEDT